jgi:hypothetical protein
MNRRILIALPYACARVPLGIVDTTVARRLRADSTVRVGFDCALGALDVCAGHLLRDRQISGQGFQRVGDVAVQVRSGITVVGRPGPQRAVGNKTHAATRTWTRV